MYNSTHKLSSRIIQGLANIITGLNLTLKYRTPANPSIRVHVSKLTHLQTTYANYKLK